MYLEWFFKVNMISPPALQNLQLQPRISSTIDLVDNNGLRTDYGCNIPRLLVCFPVKTVNKRPENVSLGRARVNYRDST